MTKPAMPVITYKPRTWETHSVYLLPPGWFAIWQAETGRYEHPVPAVLVQQDGSGRRVVAAKFVGQSLVPLWDEECADTLVGVYGPGEDPL